MFGGCSSRDAASGGGLFGGPNQQQQSSTGHQQQQGGGLFGGGATQQQQGGEGPFGGSTPAATPGGPRPIGVRDNIPGGAVREESWAYLQPIPSPFGGDNSTQQQGGGLFGGGTSPASGGFGGQTPSGFGGGPGGGGGKPSELEPTPGESCGYPSSTGDPSAAQQGHSASSTPCIFVYGSLRPDDDSGMPWTEPACQGMLGQKAVVRNAKLYHDKYAVAVMNTDETQHDGQVIGWVLSHRSPEVFAEKLALYDHIEQFNPQNPSESYYKRTTTTACLLKDLRDGQQEQIGEPGDTLEAFLYHRTDACLDVPVPGGDWLKRVRGPASARASGLRRRAPLSRCLGGGGHSEPSPAPGREMAAPEGGADPLNAAIKDVLHWLLLPEQARWQSQGQLELEVRFGLLVCKQNSWSIEQRVPDTSDKQPRVMTSKDNARFEPGVSRREFLQLQARLRESFTEDHSHSTAYFTDDLSGHNSKVRVVQTSDGTVREEKTKLWEVDIALPACPYDIRIAVACETQQEASKPADWTFKRTKRRSTFRQGGLRWQVDFTEVLQEKRSEHATEKKKKKKKELYEVELELEHSELLQLAENTQVLREKLIDLVERLLFDKLNPVASQPEPPSPIKSQAITSKVTAILEALKAPLNKPPVFLGTHPVAFRRKHLNEVLNNPYLVSEKTDGTRYLLVVAQQDTKRKRGEDCTAGVYAVLVGRRNECFYVPGLNQLRELAQLPAGTVIDGELVLNRCTGASGRTDLWGREWMCPVFMAFDILSEGQENRMHLKFADDPNQLDRLSRLYHLVDIYDTNCLSKERPQLPLVRKIWHPKENVKKIREKAFAWRAVDSATGQVTPHDGHDVYVYKEEKLPHDCWLRDRYHHRTDGIIFCPNREYLPGFIFKVQKTAFLNAYAIKN